MGCSSFKVRNSSSWSPHAGAFIFNVDGAIRGKPGPDDIGGMLQNNKGEVLFMFSKHVGVCKSNEAEVFAILEALQCFSKYYPDA